MLHNVLERILKNSGDQHRNVQQNNAQNAVLFEAINLAIHLDTESAVVQQAAHLLGRFILSKETNVRYLGLDTMAHLAARSDNLDAIKKHRSTITQSLRDKDISVRRRGLDLLYSMCDTTNSKAIVGELLKYLVVADYTLREEMVLKIAILTEKFATDYEWYLDTILTLMSTAGDHVGEEVWYRIVQIVTNTEELQEYAARRVFEVLLKPSVHENLVKVGAYILGEYGHLVADEPVRSLPRCPSRLGRQETDAISSATQGRSPIEQFHILHSRQSQCTNPTKALLLTTYFKWLNLFPEIRQQLVAVFEKSSRLLDAELQQRACEYLAIARLPDEELLQVVVDEMPPFSERESALLSRLIKKTGDTHDKRTWYIGGKEVNQGQDAARYGAFGRRKGRDGPAATHEALGTGTAAMGAPPMGSGSIADDLLGLELGGDGGEAGATRGGAGAGGASPSNEVRSPAAAASSPVTATKPLLPTATGAKGGASANGPAGTTPTPRRQITHGADKWLSRLVYNSEGVLYEDAQLQVGVKCEFHGHLGRVALYFGNKVPVALESFTATVSVDQGDDDEGDGKAHDALKVTLPKIPTPHISALSQVQQLVHVECRDLFTHPPLLHISYLAGSLQTLTLRLPVWPTKFVEPVKLDAAAFFERWKQIGGAPREAQQIFPIPAGGVDTEKNRRVVGGARLGVLEGIDPNPNNVVAAGVLHMSTGGKVGCLLRVEPNAEAKVRFCSALFVARPFGLTSDLFPRRARPDSCAASRCAPRTRPSRRRFSRCSSLRCRASEPQLAGTQLGRCPRASVGRAKGPGKGVRARGTLRRA